MRKRDLQCAAVRLGLECAMWLVPVILAAACSEDRTRSAQDEESPGVTASSNEVHEVPRTLAYACDGIEFAIRNGPGEVGLFLPDRFVVVSQVESASGARYEEGDIVFWSRGDEALLEIGERRFECVVDWPSVPWVAARLSGARFRAVGNEPGWSASVMRDGSIELSMAYGQEELGFQEVISEVAAGGHWRTLEAEQNGHLLSLHVRSEACADDMSGAAFDYQVELTLDGRTYRGCGRELGRAFGGDWFLESLGEAAIAMPVVDGSRPSFDVDPWFDRFSGSTGCNRYSGGYESDLPGDLSFGPIAVSGRICEDEILAERELRFLEALKATTHFRIESDRMKFLSGRGEVLLGFVRE